MRFHHVQLLLDHFIRDIESVAIAVGAGIGSGQGCGPQGEWSKHVHSITPGLRGGKRMTELAQHLAEQVIAYVPVRQFVLSLPHRLRYALAYDHARSLGVLRVVLRAVFDFYKRGAQHRAAAERHRRVHRAAARHDPSSRLAPHRTLGTV